MPIASTTEKIRISGSGMIQSVYAEETSVSGSLTVDGFQAGLSWITVLKKRENYRKAFDNFSA